MISATVNWTAGFEAKDWIFLALTLFFGFTTVAGTVLAIVFYRKSRRSKQLCYAVAHSRIIRGVAQQHPKLQVKFTGYGDTIADFTISSVSLWNAGTASITKTDVAKHSPLQIAAESGTVLLECEIVKRTADDNAFVAALSKDKRAISLTFDHLDHNEGVTMRICHTGATNVPFVINGKIIGSGKPERALPFAYRFPGGKWSFVISLGLVFTFAIWIPSVIAPHLGDSGKTILAFVCFAIGIGFSGFCHRVLPILAKRPPIPKDLQ